MTIAVHVPMTAASASHQPSRPPAYANILSVRALTRALVWLTVASGAVVFTEPAPVDALTMGLIVLLPLTGLVRVPPLLLGLLAVCLVMAAGALLASTQSRDIATSTIHATISIYLYLATVVFAAFVADRPETRAHFILHAYLWAAFIAAVAGVVGYFDALPGAAELFTKYERAAGTFKDPNVFGAFLVPALIYALHLVVTRRPMRTMLPGLMLVFLTFAIVLSFSRGAWVNLAIAGLAYGYLSFATAATNLHRIKLLTLALFGIAMTVILVTAALQVPEIADRMADRASITQSYDVGPEGRFGGHIKAFSLILERPFGIGALQFGGIWHFEDTHNVYLNSFLNAGWVGGLLYLSLVLVTLIAGFSHLLRRTVTQPLFIVAYAAFLGVIVEGAVIDTDHWRHFYVILAILWGLMAARHIASDPALDAPQPTPAAPPFEPNPVMLPAARRTRILGPARRRLCPVEPVARRLQEERPRRPSRSTYR